MSHRQPAPRLVPRARLSVLCRQIQSSPTSATAAKTCPTLELGRSGDKMPVVGLGMWKVGNDQAAALVEEAIRMGYRHIDCACDYGNEEAVGKGIKAAIDAGVCSRADLWVTSKLWNTYHRPEHVQAACQRTLSDLGLDYLDLYLIHFPIALKFVPFEIRYPPEWIHDPAAAKPKMELDECVTIDQTWSAMEKLVDAGLVRNIGVANFRVQLLQHLRKIARIQPQVNQVELHPLLVQDQLVRYCEYVGIKVTGFSPLGAGSYLELDMSKPEESVLQHEVIRAIAKRCGRTPAQVVLKWGLQRGCSIVPKSIKTERLRENIALFDFALSAEDAAAITALDCGRRFNDPGDFCTGMGEFCPING